MRRPSRRRRRNGNGRLIERLAIGEAYRDSWHAAALGLAEDLMREPELRDEIDRAILKVLEGMVASLRRRAKARPKR